MCRVHCWSFSFAVRKSELLCGTLKCTIIKDWTGEVIDRQRLHQLLDPSTHPFLWGTTTLTRQFPILEDGEVIKRSRFLCSLNPFHWYRHFISVQRHIQVLVRGRQAGCLHSRQEAGHVQHRALWDTVEDSVTSESLTWSGATTVCCMSTQSSLLLAEEEDGRKNRTDSRSPKRWFLTMSWISTHVCLIMNLAFIKNLPDEVEAAMHPHHSLHSFQEAPE